MLPRRPERQTDPVCFTIGDSMFTPERRLFFHSTVDGEGKVAKPIHGVHR